ncbi:MAG TPA: hypothetical protein VGO62_14245, partial [Myxococcota bacterium]
PTPRGGLLENTRALESARQAASRAVQPASVDAIDVDTHSPRRGVAGSRPDFVELVDKPLVERDVHGHHVAIIAAERAPAATH